MYFIKKVTVDDKGGYSTSEIVEHAKAITTALSLLDYAARMFIKEECGNQISKDIRIIDIHTLGQINEPAVDTMLLYRLTADPHRIHVYQRKTRIIPGTIYGQSLIPEFHRIQIFELEEYKKLNPSELARKNSTDIDLIAASTIPSFEMVPIGPAGIKVPKPMTVSPMCDLIKELKKCVRFNTRFQMVNMAAPSESAPDISA